MRCARTVDLRGHRCHAGVDDDSGMRRVGQESASRAEHAMQFVRPEPRRVHVLTSERASEVMNKFEYRVVWKRRGMDRKTKRYATLKGAENRVLFMGPEPWLALKVDPDALQCCPGTTQYECGCGGLTWRQSLLSARNSL